MKLYKCDQCRKSFSGKSQLVRHAATHSGEKKYRCDQCPVVCSRSDILLTHVRTQHLGVSAYKCSQCGKCCASGYALKQHQRIHTGEKPFKCHLFQCGRSYRTQQELRNHKKRHETVRPVACKLCDRRFVAESELKIHMNYHEGVKPYQCEVCSRRFTQHSHWRSHLRIHTGDKPYKCTFENCGKSFRQSAHLMTHRSEHTGVKPYKCSVASCQATFRLPHTLKTHMRRHTGEKPYKCRQCPRAFSHSTPRNHHEQKCHGNESFSCDVPECKKAFATRMQLKTHRLVHFGVHRFTCLFCEKTCRKECELFKHLRTHTRERPFYCPVCEWWYPNYHNPKGVACQRLETRKEEKLAEKGVPVPIPIVVSPPPSPPPQREEDPPPATERKKRSFGQRPKKKSKAVKSTKDSNFEEDVLVPIPIPLSPLPPNEETEVPLKKAKKKAVTVDKPVVLSVGITALNKKFQCKVCGKVLKHQNHLNGHMSVHKTGGKKKKAKRRNGGVFPRKRKNRKSTPVATTSVELDREILEEDDRMEVEIEYATAEDKEPDEVAVGGKKAEEDKEEEDVPELELRIESVRHVPEEELVTFRPYQCDHCNKMYKTTAELERHRVMHGVVAVPMTPKNQGLSEKGKLKKKKKKTKKLQEKVAPAVIEEHFGGPPEILEIFEDELVNLEVTEEKTETSKDTLSTFTTPPKLSPVEITPKEKKGPWKDALPPILVAETAEGGTHPHEHPVRGPSPPQRPKPQQKSSMAGANEEKTKRIKRQLLPKKTSYCDVCDRHFVNEGALARHKKGRDHYRVQVFKNAKEARLEALDIVIVSPSKIVTRSEEDTRPATWGKSERKRVRIRKVPTKISPGVTAAKPFHCSICDRYFGNKGALGFHKKVHKLQEKHHLRDGSSSQHSDPSYQNGGLEHPTQTPESLAPPTKLGDSIMESDEEEMEMTMLFPETPLLSDPLETQNPAGEAASPLLDPAPSPKGDLPQVEPQKRFKCIICNFVTTDRTLLHEHAQHSHYQGASHRCPQCSKAFPTQGGLEGHISTCPKDDLATVDAKGGIISGTEILTDVGSGIKTPILVTF